jgi:hypothetical protein
MLSNIKIRSLTGAGIKTYIPSIAAVRSEVLRDLPFLRNNTLDDDIRYLQKVCQNQEAIVVLVFDGPNIVGVSLGMPLEAERPILKTPFLENHEDLATYFHFGISTLLAAYRGRGLAHHFFDIREAHVQHLKRFKKICFLEPILPYPTEAFTVLDTFWKKRGYVQHNELVCKFRWKEPIKLIYWIKEIVPDASQNSIERDVDLLLNTSQ